MALRRAMPPPIPALPPDPQSLHMRLSRLRIRNGVKSTHDSVPQSHLPPPLRQTLTTSSAIPLFPTHPPLHPHPPPIPPPQTTYSPRLSAVCNLVQSLHRQNQTSASLSITASNYSLLRISPPDIPVFLSHLLSLLFSPPPPPTASPRRKQNQVSIPDIPAHLHPHFPARSIARLILRILQLQDSLQLHVTFLPLLKRHAFRALAEAANAPDNALFSARVCRARACVRMLMARMWAGGGTGGMFDVAHMLREAVASGSLLAVVAAVSVADVALRVAATCVGLREGACFQEGVRGLQAVRVIAEGGKACMPLVDIIVAGALQYIALHIVLDETVVVGDTRDMSCYVLSCSELEWGAVGDETFLKEVCPSLLDISQPQSNKTSTSPAAPDSAKEERDDVKQEVTGAADIQDSLRHELYTRMHPKLRDLLDTVLGSYPPCEDSARSRFVQVAQILYPEFCTTVISTAAGLCAFYFSQRNERTVGPCSKQQVSNRSDEDISGETSVALRKKV